MSCHVMWCGGHIIWCDLIACVVSAMSRDAMRCHVMCAHVMSCHLLCPAMGWNIMSLRCHWLWRHVVWFELVLWRCGDPKYFWDYKVLLCTTKYYSSTTKYYNVLLLYYSVLQRTTPVVPCTTLYYNVLLQYYKVLQRTTPVLFCTTKYYNVLLQYYSVLQSTTLCTTTYFSSTILCTTTYYSSTTLYYRVVQRSTASHMNIIYNARSNKSHPPTSPNTAPAAQNESHDWSASHMKRHLQCAEQQESASNFTKYCACHAKWFSWLIRITYETSFTMRGATRVTLQLHQILRLPRKMNLMIDPHHIWNVIYKARSNKSQPPSSPNIAPATQNESHDWSASDMKRHLQCGQQHWLPSIQHHQILRLPRNSEFKISAQNPWIVSANIKTIRPWSEHEIVISHPPLRRPYSSDLGNDFVLKNKTFRAPAISQNVTKCCACHEKSHSNFTKYCACHAKWISSLIRVTGETSFRMRGATRVTLHLHQILRLPRKMNLMIDPRHIWNVT